MDEWYWVSLPHATFGIGAVSGFVRRAAPIAFWTVGRPVPLVLTYYRRRGAAIVCLTPWSLPYCDARLSAR